MWLGKGTGRCNVTDAAAVETVGVSSSNGGPEPYALEPKATVLARDDVLSGKLQVRDGGQVLGKFSGEIECDGELLIGPEAHGDAGEKHELWPPRGRRQSGCARGAGRGRSPGGDPRPPRRRTRIRARRHR